MIIIDCTQRTPEWFAARLGKVTASRLHEVIARTKSGYSTSRQNYMADLLAERLTGVPAASYTNAAMQHGTDQEPEARRIYAFEHDVEVVEVGFVPHPTIADAGCSPDGLVESGLVEVKAPFVTAQHLHTLRTGEIKSEYMTQMHFQMACTGAAWCDYVSFDPRLPRELQLFVKRIPRDDDFIETLETEVKSFLSDLQDLLDDLKRRFGVSERV